MLRHSEPLGRVWVGASVVHSMVMPLELDTIGAPAATAPAVAGTAVPDLAVCVPVVERDTPVAARLRTMFPVPVPFRVMVPEPLASTDKLALPEAWVTATATVPPVAAPVIVRPVTWDAVEASTAKAGVAPAAAAPTVNAPAAVDCMVVAPVTVKVSETASPITVLPVTVRLVRLTPAIVVVPNTVRLPLKVALSPVMKPFACNPGM